VLARVYCSVKIFNFIDRLSLQEIGGFYGVLVETTEFKETSLSATGKIERPSSGDTVSFNDLCLQANFDYKKKVVDEKGEPILLNG